MFLMRASELEERECHLMPKAGSVLRSMQREASFLRADRKEGNIPVS